MRWRLWRTQPRAWEVTVPGRYSSLSLVMASSLALLRMSQCTKQGPSPTRVGLPGAMLMHGKVSVPCRHLQGQDPCPFKSGQHQMRGQKRFSGFSPSQVHPCPGRTTPAEHGPPCSARRTFSMARLWHFLQPGSLYLSLVYLTSGWSSQWQKGCLFKCVRISFPTRLCGQTPGELCLLVVMWKWDKTWIMLLMQFRILREETFLE